MEELLASFSEEINEVVHEFLPRFIVGGGQTGFTQYMFWLCVAIVLLFVVLFVARGRLSLVPRGRFVNGVEFVVEYVRDDVLKGNLGKTADKHGPFLLTLFFFILFSNIVGVIPGCKPGTGTIGVTFALALISFVYFIVVAVKNMGALGYIKSFAPAGVAFPLNVLVGIIEAFSTFLRLITLAVRLFANMFAGHICLAAFALLTSGFFSLLISAGDFVGIASIAWLAILTVIYAIELVVAVIQAYVFTVLSAVYVQLAESEH
jgi:F-type H+-transporting ATPase subunit a